jgi:hypothetical protein
MTRGEFNSSSIACKFCGASDLEIRESQQHPGGGIWCRGCGRHQFWLSIDRAESHRPALKRGTTEQVWNAWGNCCAHCGLSESELARLGIGRTVQHCPPFAEANHNANFIPLCDWCQQQSASWMKRLKSLLDRLIERERT